MFEFGVDYLFVGFGLGVSWSCLVVSWRRFSREYDRGSK